MLSTALESLHHTTTGFIGKITTFKVTASTPSLFVYKNLSSSYSVMVGSSTHNRSDIDSSRTSIIIPSSSVLAIALEYYCEMSMNVPASTNITNVTFQDTLKENLKGLYELGMKSPRRRRRASLIEVFLVKVTRSVNPPTQVSVQFYVKDGGVLLTAFTVSTIYSKLSITAMNKQLGFTVISRPAPVVGTAIKKDESKVESWIIILAVLIPVVLILFAANMCFFCKIRKSRKLEPFEGTRETAEEWQNVPKSYDNYQARPESRAEVNPIYVDASKTVSIPPDDFSVIKPIPSRNWSSNNKKKNIKEGENTDILENTYQSVDHPKMKKRRHRKGTETEKYVVDGYTGSSVDLDREISQTKTSAAMFEDLTKQSCYFLASTVTKNTAIRLQKVVTSPTCTGFQSRSSYATSHGTSHITSNATSHATTPPVSNTSLSNISPHHVTTYEAPSRPLPQPSKVMEETEFTSPLENLDEETSLHDHTPTNKVDDTIPIQSNVSENFEPNLSTSQLVDSTPLQSDDSVKLPRTIYETCDHEDLLKKISTLQLVVDDLKEKSPQKSPQHSDVIDGNISPDNIPKPDDILQNRLLAEKEKNKERMRRKEERRKSKGDEDNSLQGAYDISAVRVNAIDEELIAEKIRNKERIRRREKAKEERKLRRSPEVIPSKNICDSTDERPDHTDAENKSSESTGSRRRSKLSKKKELWKKYARKRKVISSMESSATDLSAMSADDDERLVSSDTAEHMKTHKHHNGSLEKNMIELTQQSGLGVYPFPYLIGSNFDRVPPLRPHPPYTNPIFAPAPLHTHNNLIFNQPALQMPYGNFNVQHPPRQAFNPNNSMNNSVSNHSSGTNHMVTLPKLNNLVSKSNTDSNPNNTNNIVLPSGRGKARENERVLKKADLDKLEKAQEQARAKLKAFLDRANAEGLMDSIALNESVT